MKRREESEKTYETLEKIIAERTEQLNQANKALESFSYTVAHDLQAPLRIITGYAKVLEEDYIGALDDKALELLGVIINKANSMSQLVTNLLYFSKVSREDLKTGQVNFNDMVKEVIESTMQANEGTSAEFRLNELGTCNCDGSLVKQVWVNLLSNAVKYSAKSAHPVIEIGTSQKNGSKVYYVKDNGIGFEMKNAARIFEMFFRIHTKGEFEGNGVGLALANNIVTKHGGVMWAESEPGKGAAFYFILPDLEKK